MPDAPPRGSASRLDALAELAAEAGAEDLVDEARALSERVRDGLFYVACFGQFKRGKSTLINALAGEDILPTGVVPVTSVVTVVRHGEERSARVRFAEDAWRDIDPCELAKYVTEEQNAENRKGVVAVEVQLPCPLLASGMSLVDTPGVGSIFQGNTDSAWAFVPHVDAALLVLGADPPISAEELTLANEIGRQCEHLFVVLNKSDKLADAERAEVGAFTRRVLAERLGRNVADVFEVSATDSLAGAGPPRDWPALVAALTKLARRSGSDLVRAAESRGIGRLADRLRRRLDEERGALLRPVEQSERRVAALRACVADAERSLNDLGPLFSAEQERLRRIFAARKEALLREDRPAAREEFAAELRAAAPRRGPKLRAAAIELAHRLARERLDRWLAGAQPVAEALYVEAAQRFVDLANGFLDDLAADGDPIFAALPRTFGQEAGFRARSRLYYTFLMTHTATPPTEWFLDLVRPRDRQLPALERQVGGYLAELLHVNASRIENDFNDRVLESRRAFLAEIRKALTEVAASAERALARAQERWAQGHSAVRSDVERVDGLKNRLQALAPE